jgi:hypothetical protein
MGEVLVMSAIHSAQLQAFTPNISVTSAKTGLCSKLWRLRYSRGANPVSLSPAIYQGLFLGADLVPIRFRAGIHSSIEKAFCDTLI